jgi:hypothetical protein
LNINEKSRHFEPGFLDFCLDNFSVNFHFLNFDFQGFSLYIYCDLMSFEGGDMATVGGFFLAGLVLFILVMTGQADYSPILRNWVWKSEWCRYAVFGLMLLGAGLDVVLLFFGFYSPSPNREDATASTNSEEEGADLQHQGLGPWMGGDINNRR